VGIVQPHVRWRFGADALLVPGHDDPARVHALTSSGSPLYAEGDVGGAVVTALEALEVE
jgi:hypothetical protein